jgi:hypothetical protein
MDEKHNEVAGFIFATVVVLYAVLLAFTVIIVWEQYPAAESAGSQEAAALITVAHDASSFPEPERSQVYNQLRAYAQFVINEEWRTMDEATLEHEESTGALVAINTIWSIYRSLPPAKVDSHTTDSLDNLSTSPSHTTSVQCGSIAQRPMVRASARWSDNHMLRPGLTYEECRAPRGIDDLTGWSDRHVHLDDLDDQSSLRR